MHSQYNELVSVSLLSFLSLFSVINPIKFVIVFLSMTYFYNKDKKIKIAHRSMAVAFIILIVSMLVGEYVFKFLGINMYAFKMAGGLLLAFSGVNMLLGSDIELPSNAQIEEVEDISIFPLAIPIITGPGAISTGIVLFSDAHGLTAKLVVIMAVVINFTLMLILLYMFYGLAGKLNKVFLNILLRSCGLLLSALAVNIFLSGLKGSGLFG